MDSFQGAVLGIKLKHLDSWNAARAAHAKRYAELLAGSPVTAPASFADSESVWHCYVVEADNRDQIRQKLSEAGIESALHYPLPIHLQKAYASLGHRRGDFPVTERLCGRCLSLPMFAELTEEQVNAVATALRGATA